MKHITALRQILLAGDQRARAARAKKAGTTVAYIEKLAGGWGLPSMGMAHRLIKGHSGLSHEHFVRAWQERQALPTR